MSQRVAGKGQANMTPSRDAIKEDEIQYGAPGEARLQELEEKYSDRPRNHSKTLPFSELFRELFNPLSEKRKHPAASPAAKRAAHGLHHLSPQEQRRHIIERFIVRWRKEVGNDFYPALRLVLPDKDRDRGVYGLKENTIGKLLVKLTRINKDSEDGYNLLHWKLPGSTASHVAGDFAGRCFEVLSKRSARPDPGDMTIAEVNEQLDRLAASSGEAENLRIFEVLYSRMNAEELMWLIRIVLKQMKIGATERTFLYLWHPDGEALFNVSSSLRRVCWELYDPEMRLEQEEAGLALMQCFQPQLAQFQMPASFQKMTELLRPTEQDDEFWIEEKLDGERIQMHMVEDPQHPGGRRFGFWSRRAKEYTYLYGDGLEDENSALTRHLRVAFAPGVRNIILDGEMITWDMGLDKIVPFGTLKSAALMEQQNRSTSDAAGHRPLYRVFDILYLNDKQLTQYTLRDRRRALEQAVLPVRRRLEVHSYTRTTSADAIEPLLRDVVANASEGLVLKNPRSMYRLNSRNDDWLKVKPEYMSEFGESLDCVIVGGYFGSGRRGGTLSSFLCGLRASRNHVQAGLAGPEKCFSFFKVGGGFRVEDYAEIRHRTDGKWIEWDPQSPPTEYVELGGGEARQFERPDMWIRPRDSVVISVKAASVGPSDQFARGYTLRFPRFRRLRLDRSWDSALSVEEFEELRQRVDQEAKEKSMTVEDRKRKKPKRVKRELVIAGGQHDDSNKYVNNPDATEIPTGSSTDDKAKLFDGLDFCVLSDSSQRPFKKTKAQLETLIKAHGGTISQRAAPGTSMILIGDKRVVKVASLMQDGNADIIRPTWIRDCLAQPGGGFVLPYEEAHVFHATEGLRRAARENADPFGDSYARDISAEELREVLAGMAKPEPDDRSGLLPEASSFSLPSSGAAGASFRVEDFLGQLDAHGKDLSRLRGFMFRRCAVHMRIAEDLFYHDDIDDDNSKKNDRGDGSGGPLGSAGAKQAYRLGNLVRYGGGVLRDTLDGDVTHVVVVGDKREEVGAERDASAGEPGVSLNIIEAADRVRGELRGRAEPGRGLPRIVTGRWVEASWRERTVLDEEGFGV